MARRPEALPARKRPRGASQSGAVRKKRHSAPRRGAQRLRSAIATPGAGRWPSRRYRRARARRPTRLCARRPGGVWIPPGRARGRGAAATMGRERTSCPAARARRRKCLNPQTAKTRESPRDKFFGICTTKGPAHGDPESSTEGIEAERERMGALQSCCASENPGKAEAFRCMNLLHVPLGQGRGGSTRSQHARQA